jgi:hypothetical protein
MNAEDKATLKMVMRFVQKVPPGSGYLNHNRMLARQKVAEFKLKRLEFASKKKGEGR